MKVDFDSVFNQSSTTFSFGSPDILPMFARGAVPNRVRTFSYDESDEDFTKDATQLDVWVYSQLRQLIKASVSDPILDAEMRAPQTVFFLHLLGLDTTGHSYRPHSREYMVNIRMVDHIVSLTEKVFNLHFEDDETAYVFTADHGMSVIGNHGDGHPDNTRTPLIAWGAGFRGPLPDSTPSSHDDYSERWGLNHLLRRDVEQADIATLMASVLGINWPVNSVGVLPDSDPSRPGYLAPKGGDETLAEAALVNAKVLLEHYRVKHELKQEKTLFYRPFAPLEGTGGSIPPRVSKIDAIQTSIQAKEWNEARLQSSSLIKDALEGIRYLETYDRFLIRVIVSVAYVGWAAYSSLYILRPLEQSKAKASSVQSLFITGISRLVFLCFWSIFVSQGSPWTFYLYIAFPCYFWQQFLVQILPIASTFTLISSRNFVNFCLVVGVLQSMVAAYTHREIWSYGLGLIGFAWPLYAWPRGLLRTNTQLFGGWCFSCLVMAVFPLLPVDKSESLIAILSGGAVMVSFGLYLQRGVFIHETGSSKLLFGQMALILVSMAVTFGSVQSLQAKTGLPAVNQVAGWLCLLISSILPFINRSKHATPISKITMYFLGFGACFVILSISIEGLFYVAYTATLLVWIEVEAALRNNGSAKPTSGTEGYQFKADDLRIALFFLFFVQIAFFGTGNVASISSFYLEPVYRLVPIFSPFLMAALLIFKIVAPYAMLSVAFSTLNARLHLPPFSLFLVALSLTDGMTLTFFYQVSDTGICAAGEYLMADVLSVRSRAD
ncbi:hypothetical protein ONZ45_g3434 [Pleurotus djamor]|nr:hypothetical protein ONZ45_g3434 [Pleurotus djamor]